MSFLSINDLIFSAYLSSAIFSSIPPLLLYAAPFLHIPVSMLISLVFFPPVQCIYCLYHTTPTFIGKSPLAFLISNISSSHCPSCAFRNVLHSPSNSSLTTKCLLRLQNTLQNTNYPPDFKIMPFVLIPLIGLHGFKQVLLLTPCSHFLPSPFCISFTSAPLITVAATTL